VTGEITGGWGSVVAAYAITATVLLIEALRLARARRRTSGRSVPASQEDKR
jgi:hypothetical protein